MTNTAPETNTEVFPKVTDYTLNFLYRDTNFERASHTDASLTYAYFRGSQGGNLVHLKKTINNLLSRIRVFSSRALVFSNWYDVELMYTGLRKPGACRVKTWQGLKIHVGNVAGLRSLDAIFVSRLYDQKPCRIPQNSVILDIGAHVGAFSLYAASLCKARRVISCEPCQESFALLKENVESNKLSNVITLIALAVGAAKETRILYLSESSDSHSFYCKGRPIKVQCTTLKQLLDDNNIDNVDFLKMNCEGGEYEILQNIDESTANRIDVIGMTIHNHPRDWFVSRLRALGFSVIETEEKKFNDYILAKRIRHASRYTIR